MNNLRITGATGFIGKYFIEKYNDTYAIKSFSFLHDNLDELNLKNIDTILHLSALVHQMGGASKEEYERVNVTQTLALAHKAKENGVGHFIFMSSVKVYGEESDGVYTEQSKCHPQDEYGKSKLKAEVELLKLEDESFKVSIIRTPIVYGYGVKANIKSLVSLVRKVSFLPFGGITNRRSMVYIGNLCHLIDTIVKKQKKGIYLAGDDKPLSTTKFIELIANELHKKVYLIKIPFFETLLKFLKPSFHKRLYESLEVNNSLTQEQLGFQNLYTVEEGIKYMIHGENR